MATVHLLCGAARSGRARHVDGLLRDAWGHAALLVPTRQYARRRAEQFLLENDLPGAWGRPIAAFGDFVLDLLRANGIEPARVRDVERRFLVERAVARLQEQGRLEALGPAAETKGFIAHVMRVIADLKQAAIEPGAFRGRVATRENHTTLDTAVADIYAAYQEALLDADAYDVPGLFWEADVLCREERPAVLAHTDTLLFDGFDDFTPSEFRLIEALAEHVDTLALGLNYDTAPDRQDLYEVPAKTARRVRARFEVVARSFEEEPSGTFAEFASSRIFGRGSAPSPKGLIRDLEITPCADFVQEVETIGRRVKTLLLDEQVPADEIVIVYRNLGDAAATLRTVFDEFGIPVRIIHEPSLSESAVCGFVLGFLDAIEAWERTAVVDVLTSPWFRPQPAPDPELAAAFALLSRVAQVIAGPREWVERLERLVERFGLRAGEDVAQPLDRMPRPVRPFRRVGPFRRNGLSASARRLLGAVRQLGQLAQAIPAQATPGAYAHAVDDLIEALGIEGAVRDQPIYDVREPETKALEALRDLLGRVTMWHDNVKAPEPRAEFTSRLRQAMAETTFAWPGGDGGVACLDATAVRQAMAETTFAWPSGDGGVACLDATAVRHLRFDYVFFAGVNEGDTPAPPFTSAVYSERDLENLQEAGIELEGKRAHSARELLFFHHVLDVPRKHLCISWHTVSRRGQEKLPSPYLADLIELFPDEAIQRPLPPANAFVPDPEEVASWRDLRNAAFSKTGTGPRFAAARAGAEIETARHDATPYGIYDGVLKDTALVSQVADQFDEDHVFSVSQIETYVACPFRFFVERLLDVDEAEVPVAEFDPLLRGIILHAILEAFHEHFRGIPTPAIPEDAAHDTMSELTAQQFDAKAWRSSTAPPGVVAVEQRRLSGLLARYLRIERERNEADWQPQHFEVAFGETRGESRNALAKAEPFALTTPGGPVRFAGRIDRVDRVDLAGHDARIIDYKTSVYVTKRDIQEGRSLQLTLYALALEEFLMPGALCAETHFLPVGRAKRRIAMERDAGRYPLDERVRTARQVVADAVAAIRAGSFPPTPSGSEACTYCPAKRACRYEPSRIERKEAAPHG